MHAKSVCRQLFPNFLPLQIQICEKRASTNDSEQTVFRKARGNRDRETEGVRGGADEMKIMHCISFVLISKKIRRKNTSSKSVQNILFGKNQDMGSTREMLFCIINLCVCVCVCVHNSSGVCVCTTRVLSHTTASGISGLSSICIYIYINE